MAKSNGWHQFERWTMVFLGVMEVLSFMDCSSKKGHHPPLRFFPPLKELEKGWMCGLMEFCKTNS